MNQCINPDCLAVNLQTSKFCQKCGNTLLLQERYRPLKLIGKGGFGKTFLAVDEGKPSQPYCVIKQFFPEVQGIDLVETAEQLFYQEAILLEKLGKHPQIPKLLAYFTRTKTQYLVQEYIEGNNLEQELEAKGVFSEVEIKKLLIDLLTVIDFAHSQRVIHRDIKPENIIKRKSDGKLILVDFGAAQEISNSAESMGGFIIGSTEYMPPEQTQGEARENSDLYSLGVTCLYLLTQISPLELYNQEELSWCWRDYLVDNSVSAELGEILDKLVEHQTNRRYATAKEVLADLHPQEVLTLSNPLQKTTSSQGKSTTQSQISITKSQQGMDYSKLEQLLAGQKWKEADEETARLMLAIIGKESEGYLYYSDYLNFPIPEYKIIDKLWVNYSDGHFGFSVQKQIWIKCGGIPGKYSYQVNTNFDTRVGWSKFLGIIRKSYSELTFNTSSPKAHLPAAALSWDDNTSLNFGRFVWVEPKSKSERGIEYNRLEHLLAKQKWKEADEETARLMLAIMRLETSNFYEEDCLHFPVSELKIIDQLWVKYSAGHFGFSVQKQIWIKYGGIPGQVNWEIYKYFTIQVGWRRENWMLFLRWYFAYHNLTFNTLSPKGHLPSNLFYRCTVSKGSDPYTGIEYGGSFIPFLFSKLD